MPFHSKFTIKPEWEFIYLVHQRFLDLIASDLMTAGGKVFKSFQNPMLWGSSLRFSNFFLSKTGSKYFIWSHLCSKRLTVQFERLNLHSWSCVYGFAVSIKVTLIYHYSSVLEIHLILPNLLRPQCSVDFWTTQVWSARVHLHDFFLMNTVL